MKLAFKKKEQYNELGVIDEIVRARLFQDYEVLDCTDNPKELKEAYATVLRFICVDTDKRLKMLDN